MKILTLDWEDDGITIQRVGLVAFYGCRIASYDADSIRDVLG